MKYIYLFLFFILVSCNSSEYLYPYRFGVYSVKTVYAEGYLTSVSLEILFRDMLGDVYITRHYREDNRVTLSGSAQRRSHFFNIEDAILPWRVIALDSNYNFFLPIQTEDKVYITKFPVNHNKPYTLVRRVSNLFAIFFIRDSYIIIFEPNIMGNTFVYTVNKLNLYTNSESLLISKEFDLSYNIGSFIINIYVYENYIYVLEVIDYDFFMNKYDFYGNLISSSYINMDTFLYMDEVSHMDDIINFSVYGNYFIFETIHDRIAIFRKINNELLEIEIPMYLQMIGSTKLIRSFEENNDEKIYFWNFHNSSLYILDLSKNIFNIYNVVLNTDEEGVHEDYISSALRDGDGNIIIGVISGYELFYFFIDRDTF